MAYPLLRTAILAVLSTLTAPVLAQSVFINELHYDNDGTDLNERVEIVGPAGTSLTGWRVVLYNGADGVGYSTINLSGTLTNQCSGYGTLAFNVTGIQNGAPDGLALVNAAGSVVEFLSYEGTFTASGGAASGRRSVDMGVSEGVGVTGSQSLQRRGTGTTATSFTFAAPSTASFGACNSGQSFPAPDAAPTLVSSNPANNATGVAVEANLLLTFSEPVNLGAGAFAISCPSGARTAAVTRSGNVVTLNPGTNFAALEQCTLSLTGSAITDLDGTPTPMAGNASISFRTAAAVSGYYAGVNTTSASALRSSLHAIIDDHTRFPYTATTGTDTWDILDRADQDPLNSSRILDVYKNAVYTKAGGGNNFYNREHSWPKSLGFPNDAWDNYPYTDTHMLMASDITYNADRGNLPFGSCSGTAESFPTLVYNGAGGSAQPNKRCGGYWEVWTKRRGDIARAMLYMDVRYEGGTHGVTGAAEPDLRLTDNASLIQPSSGNASVAYMGLLSVLLQWHQQDPVDEAERLRNEVIYSYQRNRNPFIDNPQWAACVFQSVCN